MDTNCPNCKTLIDKLTFYPHLQENFLKKGVDLSGVPLEIIEDLPKSHLHVYHECQKCKYKIALCEIILIEEDEVDKLKNKGYTVSEKRTVYYWNNWLKENGKK